MSADAERERVVADTEARIVMWLREEARMFGVIGKTHPEGGQQRIAYELQELIWRQVASNIEDGFYKVKQL